MNTGAAGLALRKVQAATLFDHTDTGRLTRGNSPDVPAAPRMWMAGSAAGNAVRMRFDVGEETAREIEALVAGEPPLHAGDRGPVHLHEYVELLDAEAPVEETSRDLTYVFAEPLTYVHDRPVVRSHTPEGARLLAELETEGLPEGLTEMGFADTRDLWPPWCVALYEDTVVSVAFTARLSRQGAEVGVATPRAFRGRGFAAAATAGWASLPALEGRVLFYSTDATNRSSRRVAERLRLPLLGPSFSIR